jgi:hypothetical protein
MELKLDSNLKKAIRLSLVLNSTLALSGFYQPARKTLTRIVPKKVVGFVFPYYPKFLVGFFISLEKFVDTTFILKKQVAHILLVGKVQ